MALASFPTTPDGAAARPRAGRSAKAGPRPPEPGEDASTVLERIRTELVDLRTDILDLQRSLGPTLAAAAGDGSVSEAAQGLDLVAQSLDGLSTFIGAVVLDDRGSCRFDIVGAASQVRLGALSARLAGRSLEVRHGPDGCGDVELF